MKTNENEMLFAIGEIDEKLLESARPRGRAAHKPLYRYIAVAASLVLVVGVVLGAALLGGGNIIGPTGGGENNDPADGGNNDDGTKPDFHALMMNYLIGKGESASEDVNDADEDDNVGVGGDFASPEGGIPGADAGSTGSNGSYLEVTDNQIEGIIEGDLAKATEKYIFRFYGMRLYIYAMDGENSHEVSVTELPLPEDYVGRITAEKNIADMFLSDDGNTVTIFFDYSVDYIPNSGFYKPKTCILSIDVSNVRSPKVARQVLIFGNMSCVRKTGNSFYIITSCSYAKNRIDLDAPETFIPSVEYENGRHICATENIIYPEEIESAVYSYITVLDEKSLDVVSDLSVMGGYTNVYFTDNHIALSHPHGGYKKRTENGTIIKPHTQTRMHLVKFSGDELDYVGETIFEGYLINQYSIDEHEGHLRLVATKDKTIAGGFITTVKTDNASLYVYSLKDMSLVASVENFAPDGEGVTAARFEGDILYVCTADIVHFSDPVYFFDLSDYSNITYSDTGYIDGFSTSLIDLGEGYLLGVGVDDWLTGKLEVYKQDGDKVVSVSEYLINGFINAEYKSFLINREENIFGFAASLINEKGSSKCYIILQLDGEKFHELCRFELYEDEYIYQARPVYHRGYFYLTVGGKFYFAAANIK